MDSSAGLRTPRPKLHDGLHCFYIVNFTVTPATRLGRNFTEMNAGRRETRKSYRACEA